MAFTITSHRLQIDGAPATVIKSRFTGGAFANTPKILVVHFTFGASGRSSANWFNDPNNPGSSAHVVIDRDGSIIQCVDFNTIAWHAGNSRLRGMVGLNQFSFGMELANWGYLKRAGDGWTSHTGTRINDPFLAAHKAGNPDGSTTPIGWEPYPSEQIASAVALARALVTTYGVNEIVGHEDIAPGRKWDPGPAFDMAGFRARVFGDRADNGDIRMKVSVGEGLNLRSGAGTQFAVLELLPDGTIVEPIEVNGQWMSVSVLNANGEPRRTGWVHSRFLVQA